MGEHRLRVVRLTVFGGNEGVGFPTRPGQHGIDQLPAVHRQVQGETDRGIPGQRVVGRQRDAAPVSGSRVHDLESLTVGVAECQPGREHGAGETTGGQALRTGVVILRRLVHDPGDLRCPRMVPRIGGEHQLRGGEAFHQVGAGTHRFAVQQRFADRLTGFHQLGGHDADQQRRSERHLRLLEREPHGVPVQRLDIGKVLQGPGDWRGAGRIHDRPEAGYDILGIEAAAVAELHIGTQRHGPGQSVGRNPRFPGGQQRHDPGQAIGFALQGVQRFIDLPGAVVVEAGQRVQGVGQCRGEQGNLPVVRAGRTRCGTLAAGRGQYHGK